MGKKPKPHELLSIRRLRDIGGMDISEQNGICIHPTAALEIMADIRGDGSIVDEVILLSDNQWGDELFEYLLDPNWLFRTGVPEEIENLCRDVVKFNKIISFVLDPSEPSTLMAFLAAWRTLEVLTNGIPFAIEDSDEIWCDDYIAETHYLLHPIGATRYRNNTRVYLWDFAPARLDHLPPTMLKKIASLREIRSEYAPTPMESRPNRIEAFGLRRNTRELASVRGFPCALASKFGDGILAAIPMGVELGEQVPIYLDTDKCYAFTAEVHALIDLESPPKMIKREVAGGLSIIELADLANIKKTFKVSEGRIELDVLDIPDPAHFNYNLGGRTAVFDCIVNGKEVKLSLLAVIRLMVLCVASQRRLWFTHGEKTFRIKGKESDLPDIFRLLGETSNPHNMFSTLRDRLDLQGLEDRSAAGTYNIGIELAMCPSVGWKRFSNFFLDNKNKMKWKEGQNLSEVELEALTYVLKELRNADS